jgi:hypothetical protein
MEEVIPPSEAADVQALIEAQRQLLDSNHRPVRRGQHPKHHGCVRAEFVVEPGLPADLARGVFAQPRSFPAWVRFSNGSQDDDRRGDVHGMAIKLMDVAGEKLLEGERDEPTQDFVLMDHPAFFGKDARSNRWLVTAMHQARQPSLLKRMLFWVPEQRRGMFYVLIRHFLLGMRFRELGVLRAATANKPLDALALTYWSATPYLLGDGMAVKYKAVPVGPPVAPGTTPADAADSPDRLRAAMRERLRSGEVRFDFHVQRFVDQRRTPIEDASVEWREEVASVTKVAQVMIPRQEFDVPAQMEFCEHLSYTPWHSLPVHRPLGGVNRARRLVYQSLSATRHQLNGVPLREPRAEDNRPGGTT